MRASAPGAGDGAARALGDRAAIRRHRGSRPAQVARGDGLPRRARRCRSRRLPQVIEGDGPDAAASRCPMAAARWSRGSATSPITSSPIPICSTITASAIPRGARAALALLDALNATDARRRQFRPHRERPRARAAAPKPAAPRVRAALPGDDPGPGRRRLARRPARRRSASARPRREERAIALGKAALVENSAGLIRLARREARLGGAYAEVVRQEAARAVGAPPALQGEALDAYLDRLSTAGRPDLQRARRPLSSRPATATSWSPPRARSFQWKKDIIR